MNDFFGVDDLLSQAEEDHVYSQMCGVRAGASYVVASRLPAESESAGVPLGSPTGR